MCRNVQINQGVEGRLAGFEMMTQCLDDVMGLHMWLNVPFLFLNMMTGVEVEIKTLQSWI
jgi:hypothetical protein